MGTYNSQLVLATNSRPGCYSSRWICWPEVSADNLVGVYVDVCGVIEGAGLQDAVHQESLQVCTCLGIN